VAEDVVFPDPGAVLRELIQLRFEKGNKTQLARELARLAGDKTTGKDLDKWRNYVNRWTRLQGEPNQHDPGDEHLELLAHALQEPVALLRLLYRQADLNRQVQAELEQALALFQAAEEPPEGVS
jgi:hypothetical protein